MAEVHLKMAADAQAAYAAGDATWLTATASRLACWSGNSCCGNVTLATDQEFPYWIVPADSCADFGALRLIEGGPDYCSGSGDDTTFAEYMIGLDDVTAVDTADCPRTGVVFTIAPATVDPGGTIAVVLAGAEPSTEYTVGIYSGACPADLNTTPVAVKNYTTDADGAAAGETTVPAGAAGGAYCVALTLEGIEVASTGLTVRARLATPQNVAAANPTTTSVDLTWDTVTGADGYSVQYSSDSGSTWTASGTSATGSYQVTGLTASTDYLFQVKATDSTAARLDSAWSASASATTATPQLAAPANLATANATAASVDLTWDAVTNADGYTMSYSSDSGSTWTDYGTTATTNSGTVDGLTASTDYTFRVNALDSTDAYTTSDWSATATASTTAS